MIEFFQALCPLHARTVGTRFGPTVKVARMIHLKVRSQSQAVSNSIAQSYRKNQTSPTRSQNGEHR